jgi:CRISPR/Cas system-associated protein endoribonuclease Cas2
MFKCFVNDNNFEFSWKEFFIMFDRPTYSSAKNQLLTVFSKLLLKFLWDSKQRYSLPCTVHGKIAISSELTSMIETNKKFKTIFHKAGLVAFLDV